MGLIYLEQGVPLNEVLVRTENYDSREGLIYLKGVSNAYERDKSK